MSCEQQKVPSLRDLCLECVSKIISISSCLVGKVFLRYLVPDDVVDIFQKVIALHGAAVTVCPYRLLLPAPAVFLSSPHLRTGLYRICAHASEDSDYSDVRDDLLREISRSDLTPLTDLLQLGSFLCEMGWYEEGMPILEAIYNRAKEGPTERHTLMALDCSYRQLVAAATLGRVAAARELADRVGRLTRLGHGQGTPLLAAAVIALARYNALIENWQEVGWLLGVALTSVPVCVPAELAAELLQLGCELLLSRGQAAPLAELAPQALAAAHALWGQRHPQTLAARRLVAEYALAAGRGAMALQLTAGVSEVFREVFGPASVLWQRSALDLEAVESRVRQEGEWGRPLGLPPYQDRLAPVPETCSWHLDRITVQCLRMEKMMTVYLDMFRHHAVEQSWQIICEMQRAVQLCERLFGPQSLRLARTLTELGRQFYSLSGQGLLGGDKESYNAESEALLRRALHIQEGHALPADHRERLVTRVTLACLYAYSEMRLLGEAEKLFTGALSACRASGGRHLDIMVFCLRGLAHVYALLDEPERGLQVDELLRATQQQRRRLHEQQLPAGGVAALLPARPWTDRQILDRLAAALGLPTVAPSIPPTVAPSIQPTDAPQGPPTAPVGASC